MRGALVRLDTVASISQGMSTSGRSAGARPGPWELEVISVSDIQDDRLLLDNVGTILIERNAKTEKYLLQPDDVLVTARSTVVKVALVPPTVSRTVADASLLVVRPRVPDAGLYLWWFLTSAHGRQQVLARMAGSTTLRFLSADALGELQIPWPADADLYRLVDLIDASERAYAAATEAARLRREVFRDAVTARLRSLAAHNDGEATANEESKHPLPRRRHLRSESSQIEERPPRRRPLGEAPHIEEQFPRLPRRKL